MRAYRIYLIRHGMTEANYEGRYVGSTDTPLCDEGIYELIKLRDECEYPNVGLVYTSPLKRCIQTAKVIYEAHTPIVVEQLREFDFGKFENKTITELKQDPQFLEFISTDLQKGPQGSENMQDFHKRVVDGLDSVIRDMMKKKISDAAVITHGGVIMQMLSSCGLPQAKPTQWAVGNGRGYTLLVNASLWGNNKTVEIFTAIPYGDDKTNEVVGFQEELSNEQ